MPTKPDEKETQDAEKLRQTPEVFSAAAKVEKEQGESLKFQPPLPQDEEKKKWLEDIARLSIPSEHRDAAMSEVETVKVKTASEQLTHVVDVMMKHGVLRAKALLDALNDAHLTDLFHDFAIKEGLHKKFKV